MSETQAPIDEEEPPQERLEPRAADAIFKDLRELAQSPGALHQLSAIIYRDRAIKIDVVEGKIVDEPEVRWSTSKLNKNELMLLTGLMVQSDSVQTYTEAQGDRSFAETADKLLREFHDRVLVDIAPSFDPETGALIDSPESIGLVGREAIYYGAESFYLHQFHGFTRERYRNDALWLLKNAGLSIRPMLEITDFIVDRINAQMTAVGQMRMEGKEFSESELTNSLLIDKKELSKKFGAAKAEAFIAKFATPVIGANKDFSDPFGINAVAIAPLIDLGSCLFVPSQYRLVEALYESPFYWMMADKAYANEVAKHRGEFLEGSAAKIMRGVFGSENVHENVIVTSDGRTTLGEIDVLVVYGDFVIVCQAKSKRVTLKARAGDTNALKKDFEGAIQDPYRQALSCIEHIQAGAMCITGTGEKLSFQSLPRFFPLVVLSDPFPGTTLLSGRLLERGDNIAPVIWDIGVLDCVARILPTPIEMIFYLKSRSDIFDKIWSDSEYNFLGYHIQTKLALDPEADWMVLERDFASVVDDFMIAADIGIDATRPVGVLERMKMPVVSELLAELKNADPRIASVVIDLYDFSSAALEDISSYIKALRSEIALTGKAIKAFSIPTGTGGLTYAVVSRFDPASASAAEAIAAKHKYDTKSDRWYAIVDALETDGPIDGLLILASPWKESETEAKASEEVQRLFKSRREIVTVGKARKR